MKLLVVPKLGDEKNEKLAKNQILARDFYKNLVTSLANNSTLVDDIPIYEMDFVEKLITLVDKFDETSVLEFLTEKNHLKVVIDALVLVFVETTKKVRKF